ncbi:polysaccharide deacetylase family protein [Terrilactibacillus sp. BCM23-1]|uniref:Polysaccharide deacetylase family protein n=1 Tax=Terrilactibacillus tamarindi TaxID=2599694 RepID=A0A6N8CPT9_9BACI|nr:polysaccharide deacetylase [Terrilactibacillus tamarindi]MTT32199.1 polysaccharide deacetylase family protein [Terrilactibacillus tamarindi]
MKNIKWPNKAKMALTLSFDVDAESGWILNEENKQRLSLLSASAYGRRVGIDRILRLLKKFDLKAQFFIPGYTAEIDENIVRKIDENGHSIGCHGYYHERTETLSYEKEDSIFQKSKAILSKITGKNPVGYRAPLWEITPQTLELLKKNKFLFDSSLMGDDVPYVVPVNGYKLLELPVAWLLDDWEQFHYSAVPQNGTVIEEPDKVLRLWKKEFSALYEDGGYFLLTMHPEVIGRASRIKMLEELLSFIKSHEGVWFCTPEDIYRAWQDNRLELNEYPY